ncbi:MAG: hypothetical protein HYX75_10975 [Acidobacteria bacterium]|nr:hypothetical protein [Acidobacteriota bacterium]
MSRLGIAALALCAAAVAGGCGKKSEEASEPGPAKTESQESREEAQAQPPSQQPANPLQALEQMSKALSGRQGDQKAAPPIDYKKLKEALPSGSGWYRSEPKGEMMTMGQWSYSIAEAEYDKGDAHIECKLTDYAYVQALMSPFMMMFAGNFSRESDDGYEKSVMVGGNPGFERWEKKEKSGELTLMVGKRLIVQIEGHGITDPAVLQEFVSRIDFGKIGPLS